MFFDDARLSAELFQSTHLRGCRHQECILDGRSLPVPGSMHVGTSLSQASLGAYTRPSSLHSRNGSPVRTYADDLQQRSIVHILIAAVRLPATRRLVFTLRMLGRQTSSTSNSPNHELTITLFMESLQGNRHVEIQEPCSTAGCPRNSCFEKEGF